MLLGPAIASTTGPLGEDAHVWRRQVEGFADTILTGAPQLGANVDDGLAAMRVIDAIERSVETAVRRRDGVIDAGIFAKTFVRGSLGETLDAVAAHGIEAIQFNMALVGGPSLPAEITAETAAEIRAAVAARGLTDGRRVGDVQHGPS